MEVYVDVLLLENFIINFFLLFITCKITKKSISYKKIFIGALVGAIYTLVMVIPNLYLFKVLPFKIIVSILMIFIAMNDRNILDLVKETVIFILNSMILSGLCLFLSLEINSKELNYDISTVKISLKIIMLSLMVMTVVVYRIYEFLRDRKIFTSLIYDLSIIQSGKEFKVKAFLDTGNELREPATYLPVIIVEKKYLSGCDIKEGKTFKIPYKVINGNNGMLNGFIPDKIYIGDINKNRLTKAVICLCEDNLSRTNEFGALLSRGIL